MKRLLAVPLMLVATMAHAGVGIVILDVMPRSGLWQSMVEYTLLTVRAILRI
jgi:hypothetical protein